MKYQPQCRSLPPGQVRVSFDVGLRKMNQTNQRQYFSITDKSGLEAFLAESNSKVAILFGRTTEDYPFTDHGCIVKREADDSYSYTLEGHGIGSNAKSPANLSDTIRRVFADCQRFRGGDTITIEVQSVAPKN